MKTSSQILLVLLCVLSAAGARAQEGPRVFAKVDAETAIYPGDSFVYSVVVKGGAKPDRIDVSPLTPFNPRRAGSGTSMQMVNGRTTTSYSENYAITAGQPGAMRLPPVTVIVDGKSYTTNPVEVTVSEPGTADNMAIEMVLAEEQCYVGQPVILTVRWVFTGRIQNPSMDVPVFQSDDFYIEDLTPDSGDAQNRSTIHGVPVTLRENRRLVQGVEGTVISFRKVLIPKQPGRFRLEPVTVSVNMAVGRVRTGDFFNPYRMKYERVSARSNPAELHVLPLPDEGRPSRFYGLVGRYTISASAAPTEVSVGDPITLTIRVGGNPYLKPVQWPELEQVPGLANNFKVPSERASPVVEDGDKVFTQTIRANNDEVEAVPAIPLAYFDPDRGEYAIARTDPIPLTVAPTRILTDADVEGGTATPFNREVEAVRKGLSANYYGPELLVDQRFTLGSAIASPAYAAIWAIPLLGLLASATVKLAGRSSAESVARKRRRNAARSAIRFLRTARHGAPSAARSAPDGGQARGPAPTRAAPNYGVLLNAMKGYVGDRFDRVAASLTADDCYHAILDATGDAEAAARYRDLIAACEAARYAPVDAEITSEQIQEAIALIRSIDREANA